MKKEIQNKKQSIEYKGVTYTYFGKIEGYEVYQSEIDSRGSTYKTKKYIAVSNWMVISDEASTIYEAVAQAIEIKKQRTIKK